ncbi:MAG: glycosyltransferase [Chloroflexi bacterium]|nr:glycosyltransferase [Chloroflexota bacterium]
MTREEVSQDHLDHLNALTKGVYLVKAPRLSLFDRICFVLHSQPYHVRMFRSAALRSTIQSLLQAEKFDAIYCNCLYTAQYLDRSDNAVTLAVVDQQNADYIMWRIMADNDSRLIVRLIAKLNYFKTRRFETAQYQKFDLCFSVSQEDATATALIAPSKLRIVVAPNGADLDYFAPAVGEPTVENELLFFGTLNARMNVDASVYFAHEVFPKVRAAVPNAGFTIVGRDPAREVQDLARLPGVTVVGEVSDIRPYLNRAAVVVAPVRLGAGTKLKVIESMAMGKTVVATAHACTGLIVNEGDDVVIAYSPIDFAEKLIWLLHDKDAATRISQKARYSVEQNYGWDHIVDNIVDELHEAIRRRRNLKLGLDKV